MKTDLTRRFFVFGGAAAAASALAGCSTLGARPAGVAAPAKKVSSDLCDASDLYTPDDTYWCSKNKDIFTRLVNTPAPRLVPYTGSQPVGTVIVNNYTRNLYYIDAPGQAVVYRIAIGKKGKTVSPSVGDERIFTMARGTHWPVYNKDLDGDGMGDQSFAPGIDNPMNARAIYLYENGADSSYRIHGTSEPWKLGDSVSNGCFRMFSPDVIDLYARVQKHGWGGQVIVINTPQFEENRIPTSNNLPGYATLRYHPKGA